MNSFGRAVCPTCNKAVYAAEQVIGPGRKLYHKPCLACTICSKRLDSYTLLEHDQQPYCKSCHVKNFGTRDLRSANLPHKENPASSPGRFTSSPPPGGEASLPRSLAVPTDTEEAEEERDTLNAIPSHSYAGILSNTGRSGYGGLPRTIPLSPTRRSRTIDPAEEQESTHYNAVPLGRSHSSATAYDNSPRPITQTSTGTRYGAALGSTSWVSSNTTGSPARKWGGTNPSCGRCGKSVFFAEQVKAVGKTFHKGCLRCIECNTSLDSTKLRDHEGTPLCGRCYNKFHGPQGGGYALLGKAGG